MSERKTAPASLDGGGYFSHQRLDYFGSGPISMII
jgi:hypothetical protein